MEAMIVINILTKVPFIVDNQAKIQKIKVRKVCLFHH